MATLKFIAEKVKSGELVFDDSIRKLITLLIGSNIKIDKYDELAIFDMEDDPSLIFKLIDERVLSKESQIRLFSLKNAEKVISYYIEENYFCEEAVECIFTMPEDIGRKLLKKYLRIHSIDRYAREVAKEKGWI